MIVSSGAFADFVNFICTCLAELAPTDDSRRLAVLTERLAVDRWALNPDEHRDFVNLAMWFAILCIDDDELRSRFARTLEHVIHDEPVLSDLGSADPVDGCPF